MDGSHHTNTAQSPRGSTLFNNNPSVVIPRILTFKWDPGASGTEKGVSGLVY